MEELEHRLEKLEVECRDSLSKILGALETTANGHKPGIIERMRCLDNRMETLIESVQALKELVSNHEESKQRMLGMYWLACTMSALIGSAIVLVFKIFWK